MDAFFCETDKGSLLFNKILVHSYLRKKGSMSHNKSYFTLFISTFQLSAFTFGGGYVIIPLMKKQFVDDLGWIEEEEMLNLTAIAQASPGPVAVNASMLLGYKVKGKLGALCSLLGTILPPLIILSIVSLFYEAFATNPLVAAVLQGMQAGVAAIIVNVVYHLGKSIVKEKDRVYLFLMIASFIATYVLGINVFYIILVCATIGAIKVMCYKGEYK